MITNRYGFSIHVYKLKRGSSHRRNCTARHACILSHQGKPKLTECASQGCFSARMISDSIDIGIAFAHYGFSCGCGGCRRSSRACGISSRGTFGFSSPTSISNERASIFKTRLRDASSNVRRSILKTSRAAGRTHVQETTSTRMAQPFYRLPVLDSRSAHKYVQTSRTTVLLENIHHIHTQTHTPIAADDSFSSPSRRASSSSRGHRSRILSARRERRRHHRRRWMVHQGSAPAR